MAMSMSDCLRAHTFMEMCKTEALSACLHVLECVGKKMTDVRKDLILHSVSKFIDQYNLDEVYDVESYILVQPDQSPEESVEQAEDFFVKASEVSVIFEKMQLRVVSMLIGLVVSDFTTLLLMEVQDGND